jgi:hypothetical protein
VIIWRGKSRYTGARIFAAMTGHAHARPSVNPKTGPMAQLWILPQDVAPNVAVRTGSDADVCGPCPLRPAVATGVACYVARRAHQAPLSVWRAWQGKPVAKRATVARALQGMAIRLGAYGDVAAIPRTTGLVPWLCQLATEGHTGYTADWRTADFLKAYCMASVQSECDWWAARAMGWRGFRVVQSRLRALPKAEAYCPSERVQCADCMLCSGAGGHRQHAASIAIEAH